MITPTDTNLTSPQITIESAILGALNFPALVFDADTLLVHESNSYFNKEINSLVFNLFSKYEFNFINREVIDEIISTLRSGQNYLDHKLVDTSNQICTYAVYANLLPDKQNVFIYLNLLSNHQIKDIGDRENLNLSLSKSFQFSDTRFRLVADLLPFGVYRTTEKGVIQYVNPAFAKILKFRSTNELYHTSAFDFYANPGERVRKLQNWKKTTFNNNIVQFKTKTGENIWVRDIGWVNYDSKGEIDYIEGVIEDISQQRKAYQQVHDQSDFFKEMIQTIAEGIGQINDNYILTFCNKSFASIFGFTPEEMIGENFLNFVGHENRSTIKEELGINYFRMNSSFELVINPVNQQQKFILARAIPKVNSKGQYTGSLLLLSDITERVSIEHDLMLTKNKAQETDHLKASFLANMPHEIRTPMNSILGFSSILKRPGLTKKKRDQYLDIIISHGEKLMEIINDIIDLTIIEENQVQLDITPCNLNEIFSDAYNTNVNRLKKAKKPVKLFYRPYLTDDKSITLTDGSRIKQILKNLLNNSIKFTEKGFIELGYRLENKETIICYVKDSGIGISPEIHQTIFERFRQADESFTRTYGGTGLGLTICQGLVKLLGGRIWVESDGTHGSTLYFTIPYYPYKESGNKVQSKIQEEPNVNWEGKKILLVEDDPASSEYLTEILLSKGCNVFNASNGYEAMDYFRANKSISLILLDIQLPEFDGYEVAKEIRKINSNVPIIAQTAHSMADDKKKCFEAGCNEYLAKPISYEGFINTIQKYFG